MVKVVSLATTIAKVFEHYILSCISSFVATASSSLLSKFFQSTVGPHEISAQVLSSHSVVSSSRTVRSAMCSMERSMDWTMKDNMVNGLFFCATLTSRRRGHTPFV